MSRSRRRVPKPSPGNTGLAAFRRHGGVHEDQYRTSKQRRLDGRRAAEDARRDAE